MKEPNLFVVSLLCGLLGSQLTQADTVSEDTRAAFATSRTERIAVVGIGDSNQRFGGHGWSKYMAAALAETFGCWGTELKWISAYQGEEEDYGPAPTELTSPTFTGWYVPEGNTDKVSWKHGSMHIPADDPIDVSGPLKFSLTYGTFAKGETGSFSPSIRIDQPPFNILETHEPISTVTGEYSLQTVSLKLPADAGRDTQIMFSVSPVNQEIRGPFYAESMQAVNTDKSTGIAYSTLYAQGGQSLFDMLTYFRNSLGEAKLIDYFTHIRAPLNGDKRCILMISSGLNDRNEHRPSEGPQSGFSSSSPEGFRDNLLRIVQTLQSAWEKSGGDPDSLFFAFMPSHVLSDEKDGSLRPYRKEALDLADELPHAGCILLPELVPHAEMVANRYYDRGTESNPHLSREGYKALSDAVARSVLE
ncbi:hypothetical protein [Puniceicoccus vermicola]|uniref:SGNH hydrolase-type esterase domain-containing protein n=1 Tax=Puniceicoccus vermicola TaxID=388746 RepID=A0A7X1AXT9_9BACT|nr:hypothetical protein [Puniceicoccus vermicola]MBC2600795.1 hypothetical protein [Puniceicoccus vermicola]